MPAPARALLCLCLLITATPLWAHPSVAFYYGPQPPAPVLRAFDWVVVNPDSTLSPSHFDNPDNQLFAYVSIGEVDKDSARARTLPQDCRLGSNPAWDSWIVDQSSSSCRDFYLDQVVAGLVKQGFKGLFLDTLDSYQLVLKQPGQRAAYRQGLIELIKTIHQRYPQLRLILNRGFELLPQLHGQGLVAVAAESLYRGWDQADGRYVQVTAKDRQWLLGQLKQVAAQGLTPIAIDYLPPDQRAASRQDALRISKDGIVPYVTNSDLNIVGTGAVDPQPRQILMLYDGADSPMNTNAAWYADMPLNHMGYATRSIDVDNQTLPPQPLTGQVAGIVTWFDTDSLDRDSQVYQWLRRQMAAGVPVLILGEWGFPADARHLEPLGLTRGQSASKGLGKASIGKADPRIANFESPILPDANGFFPLNLEKGKVRVRIDLRQQHQDVVAVTPWGGYALSPYLIRNLPQGSLAKGAQQAQWEINPFRFFRQALRLPRLPVPDTTTASGRRLLFAEIDGDGFSSLSWINRYRGEMAAKVILDNVIKRYPVPVSASVIASEFIPGKLYPAATVAQMTPIARAMFRLPWVEVGSHTYSHPFDWAALERDPGLSAGLHLSSDRPDAQNNYQTRGKHQYGYNLPVPGYRFDPAMEVGGAADIINRRLAPPGKQVALVQWSGDTDPSAHVLALAQAQGLANINGNNSTISRQWPSLTNVAPLGVWKGDYFQVYAPDANEDQFTDGWQPPYCGYSKVIQTFEMTGAPRRLAPLELYYHYYSGARTCALKSLQAAYHWAMQQSTTPIFSSRYSQIVQDFERLSLARVGNAIQVRHYGADQTLRLPDALGYPDLRQSRNIAGFAETGGQRYLTLGPGREARLALSPDPPVEPYLVDANARVTRLQRSTGKLELDLQGQMPLQWTLANIQGCSLSQNGKTLTGTQGKQQMHFHSHDRKVRLGIQCHPGSGEPDNSKP